MWAYIFVFIVLASDHRTDNGWMAALLCVERLKTLIILSCRKMDPCPGPKKLLGSCPALESLQLKRFVTMFAWCV